MKVRKQDLDDMLAFNPKILEFHFSDSDLNLELDQKFDQRLIVHCYEYFERKLLDIVSFGETNQIHSQEKTIELIQKAIDKTVSLNEQFQGKPSIIVHPGGYSLSELSIEDKEKMKNGMFDAVEKLDISKVNFLMENMPPYAWFFGGRWHSNVFLDANDMEKYCEKLGLNVCYDLCHAQLYCNTKQISLIDQLKIIEKRVDHFHLSDADDIDGEGLQYGEGNMEFDKIIPMLNNHKDKGFAIEVWKGHENGGKGFRQFLESITEAGLIVN
ncbi:TIM barrel protein [Nitrosopumilus maritimus]|uniref:TIM barrel protein n=1 Tax=Nitrosopumilus maritimus TaxID=338192 RepID=UPI00164F7AAC|nr:TIM barrel protein [Nitrosopumilus maritimus]